MSDDKPRVKTIWTQTIILKCYLICQGAFMICMSNKCSQNVKLHMLICPMPSMQNIYVSKLKITLENIFCMEDAGHLFIHLNNK